MLQTTKFAYGDAQPIRLEKEFTAAKGILSAFPCTVEKTNDGDFRIWNTLILNGTFHLGCATGNFKRGFRQQLLKISEKVVRKANSLTLGNLPQGWMATQPIHIALSGGGYRLWFWAHCLKQGVVRYLAADSEDGIVYNVVDPHKPCLYHYCDRAGAPNLPGTGGLTGLRTKIRRPENEEQGDAGLVCNDATTVYLLPDGTFELYSAAIVGVRKDSPECIPWDNAAGKRRIIKRWTSCDGLHFSPCGCVLAPDQDDPPWLQFYYLAVKHRPNGTRDGIIGRYDVLAQRTNFERCKSADGIHWQRERRDWFQTQPNELCLYSCGTPFIDDGDRELLFFSAFNYTHNAKYRIGKRMTGRVVCAAFPKERN